MAVSDEPSEAAGDDITCTNTSAFTDEIPADDVPGNYRIAPPKPVASATFISFLMPPTGWGRWPWAQKRHPKRNVRELDPEAGADFSDDGTPSNGSGNIGFTTEVANKLDGGTGLHLTRTGFAFGTAAYMSPEQIRGEKLDARTDLFSFGLVMYEMFTGQRAFSGNPAAVVHHAILNNAPVPLRELNSSLPAKLVNTIDKALEKDRERRYQSAREMHTDLASITRIGRRSFLSRHRVLLLIAALLIAAVSAVIAYRRFHGKVQLSETDQIVLADFTNSTGDPVFDGTLKQALSMELSQSPFLNVISDQSVNQTLKLMMRTPGERLTEATARDVCLRTNSRALLAGSISTHGDKYPLEVKVLDCRSGDTLTSADGEAENRNRVLSTLGQIGTQLRQKMGESLTTVEKYNQPLEEATTSSLEALQAYTQAQSKEAQLGASASIPYYKLAVELDPNFGYAWARLGGAYSTLYENTLTTESTKKAFDLRDRVSQRERFFIEGQYYDSVTGELEKYAETYRQWTQSIPPRIPAACAA